MCYFLSRLHVYTNVEYEFMFKDCNSDLKLAGNRWYKNVSCFNVHEKTFGL